jgi:hypothetical protein
MIEYNAIYLKHKEKADFELCCTGRVDSEEL